MKVHNFHHLNQFTLQDWKTIYFQSYDSMICKIDFINQIIELWSNWDYSKTTSKHLYMFFDEFMGFYPNKKIIQRMIDEWKLQSWLSVYTVKYNEDL